ncbi:uncharacterized protein BDW43DRAFT_314990 [Aspergillus alliaceus]|uniref:uncharacterized protein n=1 Tax=Petromyces alliaceus TaxID=209559 RepID=UPI0012A4183C|nr:uncharacterized protein BDW43DRAFT_314990 [Aspergillus alliaceus]KAB8229409.1 hypothetical protein BDW43DRAFT_314990 [Aspergillus alliaceus]
METTFAIEGTPRNDEVKLQVLQSIDACGLFRPKDVSVKDCTGLTGAEEPEAALTPARAPTPELEPEPEPEQSEVSEISAGDTPEDMQVSLCKIDYVYDKKLEKRMFLPYNPLRGADEQDTSLPSDEHSKWVVVLRRVFCRYDQSLSEVCIDIKSPLVFSVLHKAIRDMRATLDVEPSHPGRTTRYFDGKIAQDKGELCVEEHVNLLLWLVEEQYAPAISDIEHMFPKGTTTLNILREAFFPKDIIVDGIADTPRAYRVTKAEYRVDTYGKRYLHIKAVYIDYDDTVPAFSFEDKKFLSANIGDLEDITFNQEVFRQLVLPDPTKEIVRVMVQSRVNGVDFDDFTKESFSICPLWVSGRC